MSIEANNSVARRQLVLTICVGLLLIGIAANAEVSVAVGPTEIPRGDATGATDITLSNGLFAVAIAVETAPPWGVARGGIIDIALVEDGELGYDIASLADFMPNNWSSWPTTYQRVTVEKSCAAEAIVKTERDWGEVKLETTFHIRDGDSKIQIVTSMTNKGDGALEDLLTGYVVWPDGGQLIEQPVVSSGDDVNAPGGWTAAYDEHWLLGLHVPFSEVADRRGRDRYTRHDLGAGETRTFEAWLQIENDGTLAPMVQTEIEFGQLPSGRVSGHVSSTDGEPVSRPAVVVSKGGKAFAWTVGNDGAYDIALPAGDYEIYATAGGYAQGRPKSVTVSEDGEAQVDFSDVKPPGRVQVKVSDEITGRALDAKISINEGYKPLISYFGKSTFFTELDSVGELMESIAPGQYVFEVSAGGGFLSMPQTVSVDIEPGKTHELSIEIPVIAAPNTRGWYSADLHHHSDVLDGFTEPEYVLRSELAAGVDVAFLSDHDSVVNNEAMQLLAEARGAHFMPGTELSPSWGHFNAYPVDDGKTVDIDTGQATVQEIFATARDMGADVVAVNHPYSDYGYFENLHKGAVPGGSDDGYDLVEIGPVNDNRGALTRNTETIEHVWRFWNEGQRTYLAAGSDVHDVWVKESARARSFVYVEGDLTIEKFVAGLKAGHAFASQGPLVYPDILFGSEVQHPAGTELELRYLVEAVAGLRSVQLIERGNEVVMQTFAGAKELLTVEFSVSPGADTWYSVVIEDMDGRSAYSNPVWVVVE